MSLNKVIIMGSIGKDIELRHTQSGTSVCTFDVAVERDFKNADGSKETDWLTCVAWRNTAEFISKYFSKGRRIVVEGSLQNRKWQDKNGQNRVSAEIQVANAYFADSVKSHGNDNSTAPTRQETSESASYESSGGFVEIEDDGQLPF